METVRSIVELKEKLNAVNASCKIAFVPTMGALHEGHIKLLQLAKLNGAFTICSIFVNPTQFNDQNDYELYPRNLETDANLLNKNNCDLLFTPDVAEIYPANSNIHTYLLGSLETKLEGQYRPGHFQGVCQVVDRLLSLISPDYLYLGKKDYQQCLVIEKMLQNTLYSKKIELVKVNTVRRTDGLALSSRNLRLSTNGLSIAHKLYESIQLAANSFKEGISWSEIETYHKQKLLTIGFDKIDYFTCYDAINFKPIFEKNNQQSIILAAVYLEGIRLIDNLEIL
ncbi:MAG: pantoate--beta-alanine ligase [Sediminibacterium sp.]